MVRAWEGIAPIVGDESGIYGISVPADLIDEFDELAGFRAVLTRPKLTHPRLMGRLPTLDGLHRCGHDPRRKSYRHKHFW